MTPRPAQRFESLFRENSRALLTYSLRRVATPEDAADVVAETMLVAWRRLHDAPIGLEERLWLYGIARRVVANERRSARRRDRLGQRLREDLSRILAADTDKETDALTSAVDEAMSRLSEPDRELLRLTTWEDLDSGAAARAMSISATAARTRLHRARARLRAELAELGWTGGVGGRLERSGERSSPHYAKGGA